MSDDACMSCLGGICGIFCIGTTTALGAWCNTKTYGANGCGCGGRGCCGSCCSDSFNEDAFDKEIQKDMEKTRDPNASPSTGTQPSANQGMTIPAGNEPATVNEPTAKA